MSTGAYITLGLCMMHLQGSKTGNDVMLMEIDPPHCLPSWDHHLIVACRKHATYPELISAVSCWHGALLQSEAPGSWPNLREGRTSHHLSLTFKPSAQQEISKSAHLYFGDFFCALGICWKTCNYMWEWQKGPTANPKKREMMQDVDVTK